MEPVVGVGEAQHLGAVVVVGVRRVGLAEMYGSVVAVGVLPVDLQRQDIAHLRAHHRRDAVGKALRHGADVRIVEEHHELAHGVCLSTSQCAAMKANVTSHPTTCAVSSHRCDM